MKIVQEIKTIHIYNFVLLLHKQNSNIMMFPIQSDLMHVMLHQHAISLSMLSHPSIHVWFWLCFYRLHNHIQHAFTPESSCWLLCCLHNNLHLLLCNCWSLQLIVLSNMFPSDIQQHCLVSNSKLDLHPGIKLQLVPIL